MKNIFYLILLLFLINPVHGITNYQKNIIDGTWTDGQNRDTINYGVTEFFQTTYGSFNNIYINIGNNSPEMFNRHLIISGYYQLYFPYSSFNNLVYEINPVDIYNLTWNNEPNSSFYGNFINYLGNPDTDLNNSNTSYIIILSDVSPFYEAYTIFDSDWYICFECTPIKRNTPYIQYNTPTIESFINNITNDGSTEINVLNNVNIVFNVVGEDLFGYENDFTWQTNLNNQGWINQGSIGKYLEFNHTFNSTGINNLKARIYYPNRNIYSSMVEWNITVELLCTDILFKSTYIDIGSEVTTNFYGLQNLNLGYTYSNYNYILLFEITGYGKSETLHLYCNSNNCQDSGYQITIFNSSYFNVETVEGVDGDSSLEIIGYDNYLLYNGWNKFIITPTSKYIIIPFHNYDSNTPLFSFDSYFNEHKPYITYLSTFGSCFESTPTPTSTPQPKEISLVGSGNGSSGSLIMMFLFVFVIFYLISFRDRS